jgi:hypothetical protein
MRLHLSGKTGQGEEEENFSRPTQILPGAAVKMTLARRSGPVELLKTPLILKFFLHRQEKTAVAQPLLKGE